MYKSIVFVTVTACVNAGTVSMLWMVLELGNSSLISVTSQELFFKPASICYILWRTPAFNVNDSFVINKV